MLETRKNNEFHTKMALINDGQSLILNIISRTAPASIVVGLWVFGPLGAMKPFIQAVMEQFRFFLSRAGVKRKATWRP